MRLSKSFALFEFLKSGVASRLGIELNPPTEDVRNLQLLCIHVLQPLRNKIGRPIRINSGWRSNELNKAIGGAFKVIKGRYVATSQHCQGKAADIVYIDRKGRMDNKLIFDTIIDSGIEFDQMINEFNYSWIHISYNKDNNRNEILEAYKDENNKTKYKKIQQYKSL